MDKDNIRKRMSQIELEIDEMNQVIDENLQLVGGSPEASSTRETREMALETPPTETTEKINTAKLEKDQVQKSILPNSEHDTGTDMTTDTSADVVMSPSSSSTSHEMPKPQEPPTPPQESTPEHTVEPQTSSLLLPKTRDAGEAPKRHPSNPFRVVSVNNNKQEATPAQKVQSRHDYLTSKCTKLQREIKYLAGLRERGVLTPDDAKKLDTALFRLQDYLDRKTKERYELGVLLSRQLRREIDRGENGQFWVGQ